MGITPILGEPALFKTRHRGFPGGAVVKNPPANVEFNPWPRKIPHAAEQLSPCTTITEPAL